jgi:hypothetical protein
MFREFADKAPRVAIYQRREELYSDVLAEDRDSVTSGCVYGPMEPADVDRGLERSKHMYVPLKVLCPNAVAGQCSNKERRWLCAKCTAAAMLAGDGRIYCECGAVPLDRCWFRCDHPKHPKTARVRFEDKTLAQLMRDREAAR